MFYLTAGYSGCSITRDNGLNYQVVINEFKITHSFTLINHLKRPKIALGVQNVTIRRFQLCGVKRQLFQHEQSLLGIFPAEKRVKKELDLSIRMIKN